MFEARWVYKLGLTLIVKDEEQTAHVRFQIMCYGAICEGLLHDVFEHAHAHNLLAGKCWRHHDPPVCKKPIASPTTVLRKNFKQLNEIANEEGIVNHTLYMALESLRTARNTIHSKVLAAYSTPRFYLEFGIRHFQTVIDVSAACKAWKAANP
jgi:hypothetical protein